MRSIRSRLHRLETECGASVCPLCRQDGPPSLRFVISESDGLASGLRATQTYPSVCRVCGTSPTVEFIMAEEPISA